MKINKIVKFEKSFTLIELLVVIAIIGILASVVLVSLNSARNKANETKAKAEARQIYNAIVMLENDTGLWPGRQLANIVCIDIPGGCPASNEICDDGCAYPLSDCRAGLVACQPGDTAPVGYPGWAGPYLSVGSLTDPWESEYFFDTDYYIDQGTAQEECVVIIGSYGADGEGSNMYDDVAEGLDNVFYTILRR